MKKAVISAEIRPGVPVIPNFTVCEISEDGTKSMPVIVPELSLERMSKHDISSLIKDKDNKITIEGFFIAINGTVTDISSKTLKMYLEDLATEQHDYFELIIP